MQNENQKLPRSSPSILHPAFCILHFATAVVFLVAPCTAQPAKLPPKLKVYESPYYHVYTDIAPDSAREAVMRMTKMAETYHARTASFSGVIREKLPFYLFDTGDEYHAAGGMAGSAGVFDGRSLMAMAIKDRDGHIARPTWHIVQHE